METLQTRAVDSPAGSRPPLDYALPEWESLESLIRRFRVFLFISSAVTAANDLSYGGLSDLRSTIISGFSTVRWYEWPDQANGFFVDAILCVAVGISVTRPRAHWRLLSWCAAAYLVLCVLYTARWEAWYIWFVRSKAALGYQAYRGTRPLISGSVGHAMNLLNASVPTVVFIGTCDLESRRRASSLIMLRASLSILAIKCVCPTTRSLVQHSLISSLANAIASLATAGSATDTITNFAFALRTTAIGCLDLLTATAVVTLVSRTTADWRLLRASLKASIVTHLLAGILLTYAVVRAFMGASSAWFKVQGALGEASRMLLLEVEQTVSGLAPYVACLFVIAMHRSLQTSRDHR